MAITFLRLGRLLPNFHTIYTVYKCNKPSIKYSSSSSRSRARIEKTQKWKKFEEKNLTSLRHGLNNLWRNIPRIFFRDAPIYLLSFKGKKLKKGVAPGGRSWPRNDLTLHYFRKFFKFWQINLCQNSRNEEKLIGCWSTTVVTPLYQNKFIFMECYRFSSKKLEKFEFSFFGKPSTLRPCNFWTVDFFVKQSWYS